MSTLKATNIKNESSASNNIVLDSGGGVAVNNGVTLGTGTTISSPASDTFAVSTNGGERIRIDSSGRFGVGTATITGFSDYTTVHLGSSSSGSALRLVASGDTPGTDDFVIYKNTSGSYLRSYGDPIVFYGNSSEYGRWDTSGRFLVGTDSARSVGGQNHLVQYESVNSSPFSGVSIVGNSNDSNGSYLILGKSRGTSVGSNTVVQNGDQIGGIFFAAADGNNINGSAARITCEIDAASGANDLPGRLIFATSADGASSPTERMRIGATGFFKSSNAGSYNDPSGNYHEFRSSVNSFQILRVEHTSNVSGNGTFSSVLGSNCDNTSSYHFVANANGDRMFVYGNGNIVNTNNSYGSLSDVKLKENIVDASSQWDDLKALQVRKYNFKEGQTHTQIGLIAQEVELVSPGLVSESPDRDEEGNDLGTVTKSVNYSVLYMKAVKALQEAMERIEVLEAKVAALESA